MTVRTTSKTVTFSRSFTLPGVEGIQPAGTYKVEMDEELLHDLPFAAYRRVATWIWLPLPSSGGASAQMALIDPLALQTALARDVDPDAADDAPVQAAN